MGDDMPPDDPGVAPPFHDLEVDEDGVATPAGVDTSTEAVTALVCDLGKLSHSIEVYESEADVEMFTVAEHNAAFNGPATLAALVAERDEARAKRITRAQVEDALNTAWGDWLADAESIPGCIRIHGPRTTSVSADFTKEPNFTQTITDLLNAALAAAGVEAPAAGTDGGA